MLNMWCIYMVWFFFCDIVFGTGRGQTAQRSICHFFGTTAMKDEQCCPKKSWTSCDTEIIFKQSHRAPRFLFFLVRHGVLNDTQQCKKRGDAAMYMRHVKPWTFNVRGHFLRVSGADFSEFLSLFYVLLKIVGWIGNYAKETLYTFVMYL